MIQVQGNSDGKVADASTLKTNSPSITTTTTPQMLLTTALFSALFSFFFTGLSEVGVLRFHDGLRAPTAEDQHLYLRLESESWNDGVDDKDEHASTMMIHSKLEQTRRALQGNENGIIYACKSKVRGDVRIVSALSSCNRFETSLQWSVQGPAGKCSSCIMGT